MLLAQIQEVRVTEIGGPAMDVVKLGFVAGLILGLVVILVLVATFVVIAWRGA